MIQSLVKAANILEFMKGEQQKYTIAEISEAIAIPPSTTHRILSTLISCNFVAKDDQTHLYRLGSGLISIGIAASATSSLKEEAEVVLQELSRKTNEDAFMVVKSKDTGIVIGKAEGDETLKIVENFGRQIPLHKGAIRKVILAHQPESYIDDYIATKLDDSPVRKADAVAFKKELQTIIAQGYALSEGEYIPDTIGIGAPVFDSSKNFVASVGVITPQYRMKDRLPTMIEDVTHAARELSHRIGYID
ncbi:IclR family transcriptional regulator [Peptoniphilus equinus]|uniref:IclR family transcriptional regulator n=1 Tax=Peptoniphilus equinus TaxID=3016343 RepID=A0ABY7QSU5_9FIRM|nr:IclR family transcriptional regulator [Peptoniphilus equinus]WBW49867.1 IclR family transcriptional regulator [Peptoniphilus equinus]